MGMLGSLSSLFKGKGKGKAAVPSTAPVAPSAAGDVPGALLKIVGKRSGKMDVRKRFEVLHESRAGTMSAFYKARDRENEAIVGVKVLDREKTAAFEARFKGLKKPPEGEVACKLIHPNIVRTLEYGLTVNNEQYLVMEYIDGPNFSELVAMKDSMLDGLRVPLIRQIALALGGVHAAGFIHRDLCPRNVMVDSESGVLKLIDFGLTVPATPEFMQPGNRTGNPNYMAPEVVRRQRTDLRLDMFALGITAYEICTFQIPWSRGLKGDIAMMHASQPPSDILRYRPQINPTLAKAIMKCLEQDVNKRMINTETFVKALEGVDHEDVQ